jgi:glycosyltransferase involved in cell wall biosynthesis
MSNRIKVLELGWEFPPYLTGGLGPACYGISKALSHEVDLTIIIPRSDEKFSMDNVDIIGLNQFYFYDETATLKFISKFGDHHEEVFELSFVNKKVSAAECRDLLMDEDSYGPDIMRKVEVYTEMVEQLSSHLNFDVVHAHDWLTFQAAMRLKYRTAKPLLVHVHSLETDRTNPQARNQVYDIEHNAMELADRVLPVSYFTKRCIVDYYGINADKIFPVHNGIEPVRKFRRGKTHEEKWVLFFGRITRQKGPDYLWETAVKLSKHMDDIRFYIAGSGDILPRLKNKVEESGISDKVVFTGHLKKDQLHELLSQSDVYFMPSLSEPFGLSAVEAAQFDIPCVITKQSGVSEMLLNALCADCWDTDSLANYIYGLLHYQGLHDTVVENTRKDLVPITWENSTKEVMRSYKAVLDIA